MREGRDEKGARRLPWRPILLALLALGGLALAFRALPIAAWLGAFQAWVAGLGPAGWILFALVYAICCVLLVPASLLTLGAGAAYGLATGTAVVLAGATLGATLSFALARTALREKVARMASGSAKFRALDRAIGKEGAKIVFLVRLAPIFPFTYVNYAFGLTSVRALPYVVASFLGMIPGTIAYVWLGTAAAGVAGGDGGGARRTLQVAGALLALAVTLLVARTAAKAIRTAGVEEGEG